ncbi:hypothetical protein ZOSMA_72G00770 [Zostera marina]|uniref:Uncharacterized protein n=1 Tax=Zostera marina TaxID=29655 RepID=A0A0K9NQ69_ZOSMR|nr:hypothetical protein ZOSMA_72G00770 [Zostera marina]
MDVPQDTRRYERVVKDREKVTQLMDKLEEDPATGAAPEGVVDGEESKESTTNQGIHRSARIKNPSVWVVQYEK